MGLRGLCAAHLVKAGTQHACSHKSAGAGAGVWVCVSVHEERKPRLGSVL